MADRNVENYSEDVPEIPEVLEAVLLSALNEGRQIMEQGSVLVPFTVLNVKDNLFIESHPGDSAEECFAIAQHTVEGARGAGAYAFCYDGYVETDTGDLDVLIAEGGIPGEDEGFAIGYIYEATETVETDPATGEESVSYEYKFEDDPAYIGEAPNFMAGLKAAADYADSEIDEAYLDGDGFEEEAE